MDGADAVADGQSDCMVAGDSGVMEAIGTNMRVNPTSIDVKLFGGLFMIVGTVDLVIIVMFPSYALRLLTTTGPSLQEGSH